MRKTRKKDVRRVKAWAWFSCKAFKPFKVDFGVMYNTEKEAMKGNCKDDVIIPCTITYTLPLKKHEK